MKRLKWKMVESPVWLISHHREPAAALTLYIGHHPSGGFQLPLGLLLPTPIQIFRRLKLFFSSTKIPKSTKYFSRICLINICVVTACSATRNYKFLLTCNDSKVKARNKFATVHKRKKCTQILQGCLLAKLAPHLLSRSYLFV
jgi:hypothetical protein